MPSDCYDVPSPGGGDGNPPSPGCDVKCIADAIDGAEKALALAFERIAEKLLAQMEKVEDHRLAFESKLIGALDAIADKIEQAHTKCWVKVCKALSGGMTNCYYYMQKCGANYPSIQDVMQGITTGDYLGSVGLTPTVSAQPIGVPLPPQPAQQIGSQIGGQSQSAPITQPIGVPVPAQQGAGLLGNVAQQVAAGAGQLVGSPLQTGFPSTPIQTPAGPINVPLLPQQAAQAIQSQIPQLPTAQQVQSAIPGIGSATTPQGLLKSLIGAQPQTATHTVWRLPTIETTNWAAPNACADVTSRKNQTFGRNTVAIESLTFGRKPDGSISSPEWLTALVGWLPDPLPDRVIEGIGSVWNSVLSVLQTVNLAASCGRFADVPTQTMAIIGGLLEKYLGSEAGRNFRNYSLTANALCPQEMPSPDSASRAFLSGELSESEWACWVASQNFIPENLKRVVHGDRRRIDAAELTILYRRGKIDKDTWDREMRGLGVLEESDKNRFNDLVQAFPGFDDLMRLMVRDVFNKKVVEDYGYDLGFGDNYAGKAKEYGKAIGVPDDLAREFWRAHWLIPSNTQLFEMLHRLRPGHVPPNLAVTVDDIKRTLQINDMLPFWAERLAAVSYRPLTRTDVQRAFQLGAIDRQAVKANYQDEGYDEANAEVLTRFTVLQKQRRDMRSAGLPTPREAVNSFSRCEISQGELESLLGGVLFEPQQVQLAVQGAKIKRTQWIRRQKIALTKKAYLNGVIDQPAARDELASLGLMPLEVDTLFGTWLREWAKREKAIPASQLCKLREQGLVTADEQLKRLVRLGYSVEDANAIAGSCEKDMSQRAIAALNRELKAIETNVKAAIKELGSRLGVGRKRQAAQP